MRMLLHRKIQMPISRMQIALPARSVRHPTYIDLAEYGAEPTLVARLLVPAGFSIGPYDIFKADLVRRT